MTSCIVIGAGLSGLLAAQSLQNAGWQVTVLDKGRGVGGRMASRRLAGGRSDHGAQFFTVRDDRFAAQVQAWQQAGLVVEWARGFADAAGQVSTDGHPRYRGVEGMTTVPKYLAESLDVRTGIRVSAVRQVKAGWHVEAETGEVWTADALVLTPPVPQTLDLLRAGQVTLPDEVQAVLAGIAYHPCIAVMAVLDRPSAIPAPGGVQLDSEPLRWLADNTQKGISPHAYTVTLHGASGFSRAHWDLDRTEAGQQLLAAAQPWLGAAQVIEFQVHGWRYSQPVDVYHAPCLVLPGPPPIVFAGDAFAGPRVEGAALSGWAAADALLAL